MSYYRHGSYNVACDYSGFQVKAEKTRLTHDGFRVLDEFWDRQHPQEFVRGRQDKQSVSVSRPDSGPVFVGTISPEDL